jgi:hypothetical protein
MARKSQVMTFRDACDEPPPRRFPGQRPEQRSLRARRLQSCGGDSERIVRLENRNRHVRKSCRREMGDKSSGGLDAICDVGGALLKEWFAEREERRCPEKFDLTKHTRERRTRPTLGKTHFFKQRGGDRPDPGDKSETRSLQENPREFKYLHCTRTNSEAHDIRGTSALFDCCKSTTTDKSGLVISLSASGFVPICECFKSSGHHSSARETGLK